MKTLIFAALRIIGYILSIYMVVLSCMFCCAEVNHAHDDQIKITQAGSHDHHNHDAGVCSPFCLCSCCGTTCFPESLINIENPVRAVFKHYISFAEKPVMVPYAIWQPPKLAA